MTPRQFNLLTRRLLADREHRELIAGYTTAAVINYSMSAPEEPVSAKDFMPSSSDIASAIPDDDLSPEEIERRDAFNLAVLIEAERQRKANAMRSKNG